MKRLLTRFPGGLPGAGLLILRIAISALLLQRGGPALMDPGIPALSRAAGFLAAASGISLLVGYLTQLAALLGVGAVLCLPPLPVGSGFAATSITVVAIGCVAIALTGPGSLSVDARLRGHREIRIPRDPQTPSER